MENLEIIENYKLLKQEEEIYEKMLQSSRRGLVINMRNKIEELFEPVKNKFPHMIVSCCDDYQIKLTYFNGWRAGYYLKVDYNYYGLQYSSKVDIDNNHSEDTYSEMNACVGYLLEMGMEGHMHKIYRQFQKSHSEIIENIRNIREKLTEFYKLLIMEERENLKKELPNGIEFEDVYFYYGRYSNYIKGIRLLEYSKSGLSCNIQITKISGEVEYVKAMRMYALLDVTYQIAAQKIDKLLKNVW